MSKNGNGELRRKIEIARIHFLENYSDEVLEFFGILHSSESFDSDKDMLKEFDNYLIPITMACIYEADPSLKIEGTPPLKGYVYSRITTEIKKYVFDKYSVST